MSGLSPISFEFVAAGVARRARVALARLVPSRVNKEAPSWEGHGGAPEGTESAFDILPAVWLASALSVAAGLLAAKALGRVWRG